MELYTRIQLIALLLCLCCAPAQATQALNITVYHCGVLPSDIQTFKPQDAVVHIKDLCALQQIGQQITANIIGSKSIDPHHIGGLQERIKEHIKRLDQKTIESLRTASDNYLQAYRAGIHKDSPLPAIVFEQHGKQWLYYQRRLAKAYQLWRAKS